MSIRTFWSLFLKIIGLWILIGFIPVISQFFSSLFISNAFGSGNFYFIVVYLLIIWFYVVVIRLFIFRTSWLIDKLKLDKGFTEERIEFTVTHSTVLSIGTIVIGGFIFVDSLPSLFQRAFVFFQDNATLRESGTTPWLLLDVAKTLIGYFLMTNSQKVVQFIERNSKKQDSASE